MEEPLEILPITILIGKNSVGKSTLARSFPLFRQSCEAVKRAPVLWFGDRVDFGSFEKSIRQEATKGSEINLQFGISVEDSSTKPSRSPALHDDNESRAYNAVVSISIRPGVNAVSCASRVYISAMGFDFAININRTNSIENISCNGREWSPVITDYTDAPYGALLPRATILRQTKGKSPTQKGYVHFAPCSDVIASKIAESDYKHLSEYISNIVAGAPFLPKGKLYDYVFNRLRFFDDKVALIESFNFFAFISELEDFVALSKVNSFLDMVDGALKDYYTGVKYIEPLRATAQRYYRKQELAIDEIDSKGENLAMFLDSMGPWRLKEFNQWTQENFGFSTKTSNEGGHVAVVIKEENSDSDLNLADIGFGFSQMLPVITQIWLSSVQQQFGSKETTCVVIEQPELHLHPSFQARLADVFAAAVTGKGRPGAQMIIETHSNHIVNRLGQLISKGKLKNKDVQILIFDKEKGQASTIRKAGFDKKGYLVNWPIGFFEPEA
jgi:hypothetical protein